MPVPTVDQVQKRVESLKKTLAEKGEGLEVPQRRKLAKRLRRAQRKGRRLATLDELRAAMAKAKPADAATPADGGAEESATS
jgi:hypothetical protein